LIMNELRESDISTQQNNNFLQNFERLNS